MTAKHISLLVVTAWLAIVTMTTTAHAYAVDVLGCRAG